MVAFGIFIMIVEYSIVIPIKFFEMTKSALNGVFFFSESGFVHQDKVTDDSDFVAEKCSVLGCL